MLIATVCYWPKRFHGACNLSVQRAQKSSKDSVITMQPNRFLLLIGILTDLGAI